MCWWDSETWVQLLWEVPGTDAQVSPKQLVPGTDKWVPQEQNIQNTEERQDSKIPLTLRRLMSYIYGAPILDVSRSHTTTQHSR